MESAYYPQYLERLAGSPEDSRAEIQKAQKKSKYPNKKTKHLTPISLGRFAMVLLRLSKKLTDSDWIDLGSFGFTLSSLGAMAGMWGLVEAGVPV